MKKFFTLIMLCITLMSNAQVQIIPQLIASCLQVENLCITGAISGLILEFAYIPTLGTQASLGDQEDVIFNQAGTMSAGFTHTAASTDINVLTSGIYAVLYSLTVDGAQASPTAFQIFVDGLAMPLTRYSIGATTADEEVTYSGFAVISISAGSVLTLRNVSGGARVLGGLATTDVTASVTLLKIAGF